MNWKMIPFTKFPPVGEMTGLELSVRAVLLGILTGVILGPLVLLSWVLIDSVLR